METCHKSTKHAEITSGSRDGSGTTKCSSMWQHYGNTSALYNDSQIIFFDTPFITLRPNDAKVLSLRIQKNSLLVESEGSVLFINLIISQSSSSP